MRACQVTNFTNICAVHIFSDVKKFWGGCLVQSGHSILQCFDIILTFQELKRLIAEHGFGSLDPVYFMLDFEQAAITAARAAFPMAASSTLRNQS